MYKENALKEMLGRAFTAPFYVCPNIWMIAKSDQKFPTFALFFETSLEDWGKRFYVAVFPASPEAESYASADVGGVPIGDYKFLVTAGYQPVVEQPGPGEYIIQLVFTGCEVYKETIAWP